MGCDLSQWLGETQAWANQALLRFMPAGEAQPARLFGAMRHPFLGGGKRLRPALVRLVASEFGADDQAAERPAAAIELVHSYSLVHDDLPCMDDDDLRRGRPTVHVAYDEATAVLAGDALLTLAFEVLAGAPEGAKLVGVLARDAGVPFFPIYVTSPEIVEEILDYTVTHLCDTLIMGKTRRSFFARKLDVDVVREIASHLPESVALITRSANTPHVAKR